MAAFTKLIRFKSENDDTYYADLGDLISEVPGPGSQITAYKSFGYLLSKNNAETATVKEVGRAYSAIGPNMKRTEKLACANFVHSSSLHCLVETCQYTAWA